MFSVSRVLDSPGLQESPASRPQTSSELTGTSCQISGRLRLEIKCTINVIHLKYPETISYPPTPNLRKNRLPQNWSLVPKSLRTDDLEDFLKHRLLSFIHRVPESGLEGGPGLVFLPSSQVILILSGRTQSPIRASSLY